MLVTNVYNNVSGLGEIGVFMNVFSHIDLEKVE